MQKIKDISWKLAAQKLLWIFVIVAFVFSMAFTTHQHHTQLYIDVQVNINDSAEINFIDRADIHELLQNKYGNIRNKQMNTINIAMLESIIEKNPYIANAEVFSTIDGKLIIDVQQRIPIVRVFNINNESFYIDSKGMFMPVSNKYTAQVPVANGFITSKEIDASLRIFNNTQLSDTNITITILEKIFAISNYAGAHTFWNSQIQQVYANVNGDVELIPRIGKHIIIFGDANEIEEKFDKLMLVYMNGFTQTGWNKYKSINLKFKDRVICGY